MGQTPVLTSSSLLNRQHGIGVQRQYISQNYAPFGIFHFLRFLLIIWGGGQITNQHASSSIFGMQFEKILDEIKDGGLVHRTMQTEHTTYFSDSSDMSELPDASVQLVVTSPPYPMISMWDEIFSSIDPQVAEALTSENGWKAFELMHSSLDKIWAECHRVLAQGGFACINIGDATRTIGGEFALYTNRARIDSAMRSLGFTPLPDILWRKQSNAPNKFMGSGMLPAGAYVTYEHEYIAIYRKGGKRIFRTAEEKLSRRESAFFWEERNEWFSDLWDFKGTRQTLVSDDSRNRSAAFPPELPFRIISMYSIRGDTVLDPFMGTGTTHATAFALGRNSVGYEIDKNLETIINSTLDSAPKWAEKKLQDRLAKHVEFVMHREASGKSLKHFNEYHQFKVMTSQETDLLLLSPQPK